MEVCESQIAALRALPAAAGFDSAVTLLSTPLYSNTTLVSFLPTLGWGGTVVLMKKFDAGRYLDLAQQHRMTHTMLVPVQYRRLMERPDFDASSSETGAGATLARLG